jgi:hypothetical protein
MIIKYLTSILLLLSTVSPLTSAKEEPADVDDIKCPPEGSTLSMSGLEGGNKLLKAWKKAYSKKYCPDFTMTFENEEYGAAAARVCGSSLQHAPVDLASMGGPFFPPQAETIFGWDFTCKRSQSERNTILVSWKRQGCIERLFGR